MNEKTPFLATGDAAGVQLSPQDDKTQTRRARRVARPKWLVLTGFLAFLAVLHRPWRWNLLGRPCAHHHHHHSKVRTHHYEGELLTWEDCGDVKGRPVECSTMAVPMDQFNATNSGDKVFTLPLIRLRGKDGAQNILLNPGGPGGSGMEFMFRRGEQLSTILGDGFHLLSFDPRGINSSTPLATCYPDKETRRALAPGDFYKLVDDSGPAYASGQTFAKACAETMGEHGRYVNTPQTAADMNSILDAVGQEDMMYWGFSYGTLLGQTYAGLFPERSHRVVIDGVVNQFDWYGQLASAEDMVDTTHVAEGFFDECIKAGANCTLSKFATSKDELMEKVMSFVKELEEDPLAVYVNKTLWGTLDYETVLFGGIFPVLYKPASWYELADKLAKLLDGNATEAFLSYGTSPPWILEGNANEIVQYNDGASGPEYWPQDRRSALDVIAPLVGVSPFSPSINSGLYIKQQWAIPKTHTYVPRLGVKTAHPLLILSTTYDPVCPLVSARSANKAFADSQIVEVKGYGHCSIAVASSCLAKHVRAFFYNGTLPERYTQCEADGPYFVKPEENGQAVKALKAFADPEEMSIHMAQWELARDADWPVWRRW